MRDRVRPSLLDRLTDDRPGERAEGEGQAGFSLAQLRGAVLRDLTWLLNAGRLDSAVDLRAYPEVATSTVNLGMAALTGLEADWVDPRALRRDLLTTLLRFEPRLVPDTLKVSPIEGGTGGALHFRIEADVRAEPQMLHMLMRTEAGELAGTVRVVELAGDAR